MPPLFLSVRGESKSYLRNIWVSSLCGRLATRGRLLSGRTGVDRLTTPTLLRPFRALIIRPAWDRGAQWSGRKVFREHYREPSWKSFQAREATGLGLACSGQPVIIERRERGDCKLAKERRPALRCRRLLMTSSQSTSLHSPHHLTPSRT